MTEEYMRLQLTKQRNKCYYVAECGVDFDAEGLGGDILVGRKRGFVCAKHFQEVMSKLKQEKTALLSLLPPRKCINPKHGPDEGWFTPASNSQRFCTQICRKEHRTVFKTPLDDTMYKVLSSGAPRPPTPTPTPLPDEQPQQPPHEEQQPPPRQSVLQSLNKFLPPPVHPI